MRLLEHKIALVTGGGSGIGRATVLALAEAGAAILVSDVNGVTAAETAHLATAIGARAHGMAADVTEDEDMAEVVAQAVDRFGDLHIAVNVAGGGDRRGPLANLDESDFDCMINLNLKGTFLALRHQLAYLAARRHGAIVAISSTAGLRGLRYSSLYSAAKHGVLGLTRSAALDYAESGIRVNAICPGAILTPQFERVLAQRFPELPAAEARVQMGKRYPLGRIGDAREVAALAVWLVSDQASYVTGQEFVVDGGQTAA